MSAIDCNNLRVRLKKSFSLKDQGVVSIVGAGGKSTLMYALARDLVQSGKRVLTTTTTKIYTPAQEDSPALLVSQNPEKIVKEAAVLLQQHSHVSLGGEELLGQGKLLGIKPEVVGYLQSSGLFDFILVEADGAARRSLKASGTREPVIPRVSDYIVTVVGLDVVGRQLGDRTVHRASLYSELTGLSMGQTLTESSIATLLLYEMEKQGATKKDALRIVFLNKAETRKSLMMAEQITEFLLKLPGLPPDMVVTGQLRPEPYIHRISAFKEQPGGGVAQVICA